VWGLKAAAILEIPGPIPLRLEPSVDPRVLIFLTLLTLSAGLLFGFLPARQMVRVDLQSILKGEGGRKGSPQGRLWRGFVSAQVGGCLVLLMAAGLLLRALQRAGEIERGFLAHGAYVTGLDLETEGLEPPEGGLFQQDVLDYFGQQSWVDGVALAIDLPLDRREFGMGVEPEGWEGVQGQTELYADLNTVSRGYFATLGIPILAGRNFQLEDREGAERVGLVNRAFAERVWPGQSAVGRRILWTDGPDFWITVVGVVGDTHNQGLTDPPMPMLYRSLTQVRRLDTHLVVRTGLSDSEAARLIHAGLRSLDPRLSLSPVLPLARYTAAGIFPQRVGGFISTTLGLLAVLLSAMGLYGVMANTVHQRVREMGIRMAVGADPGIVLALVLRGALRLALPGLGAGVLLAGGVAVFLRSFLLGVSPVDPVALLGVALAISGMVLAGTLIPAMRAGRVDPVEALRTE
jgi:predicted permease